MDFKGIKGEIILCSSAQPVKGNFKRVYFFSELRDFQLAGGFAISSRSSFLLMKAQPIIYFPFHKF